MQNIRKPKPKPFTGRLRDVLDEYRRLKQEAEKRRENPDE